MDYGVPERDFNTGGKQEHLPVMKTPRRQVFSIRPMAKTKIINVSDNRLESETTGSPMTRRLYVGFARPAQSLDQ
jgi:hypothetical protein